MSEHDQSDAFESAVSRLPYPVFIVDEQSHLRAMNEQARELWKVETLEPGLLTRFPTHPLSRAISRLRSGMPEEDDDPILQLRGARYELIHSYPSPKGNRRWLMLMLRPLLAQFEVDRSVLRKRWSLTPRETEIAASCIAGRTTSEICESLGIARDTFKTHMSRVLAKAGCESRSQLATRYFLGDE